jgi:hypothetical protein
MGNLTESIHARLSGDASLASLLATYRGAPAVFTADVPEDAELPYVVAVGEVTYEPFDSKTTRGRRLTRDARCYAPAGGSAIVVEQIAERVRALLHRYRLEVDGFQVLVAVAQGPTQADEPEAYGRIVSVRYTMMETS